MLLAYIANDNYTLIYLEMHMAQKQLVKRSRQSFTRLARFFNQLMREQLGCGPVTVQQRYTQEALKDGT